MSDLISETMDWADRAEVLGGRRKRAGGVSIAPAQRWLAGMARA